MGNDDQPRILMAESLFDDTNVLELMERESAILDRLTGGFEDLAFLWAAEDQLAWIRRNRDLLLDALSPDPGDARNRIVIMRAEVLFHFGNFLASVSAGLDFLYNNGKPTFSPDLLTEIHGRTDNLKKSPPHSIMRALRHRQQHAPPVIDHFNVLQRTTWHAEGEGMDLCPVLTDRTIAGVEKKLPSSDEGTAARWAEIKAALDAKKDWLSPLLGEHWAEVEGAFEDCRALVRATRLDEVEEYDRLRLELDAVRAEFKSIGSIP